MVGYPIYRSYVSISEQGAVRVTYERERLLDDKGNLCLDTSAGRQTMWEGIKDNLVDLRTTVKYKNGETKTLHGVNKTASLEDTKDQGFEVSLDTTPSLLPEQLVSRWQRPLKVRWSSCTRQIRTAQANLASTKSYYFL